MGILVIHTKSILDSRVNGIYNLMVNLDKYFNNIVYYFLDETNSPNYDNYILDILQVIEKNNISVIIFYDTYNIHADYYNGNLITESYFFENLLKKYVVIFSFIDVNRTPQNIINYINSIKNNNLYILDGYPYELLEKKGIFINKSKFLRTKVFADNSFIDFDFNENPESKILLSGDINLELYPERVFMKNFYEENKNIMYHYPRSLNKNEYPIIINKFIAGYCSSVANLKCVLAKFVEIPGCGALLVAEDDCLDDLTEFGFIDNINCILVNKSNYIDKYKYIVDPDNNEKINIIRKNGRNLILNNHTKNNRLRELLNIFNKFDNNITLKT